MLQQVSAPAVIPGGVHRPQVQQIKNNVVTLSNVQGPAMYSAQSGRQQLKRFNSQTLQGISVKPVPVMDNSMNKSDSRNAAFAFLHRQLEVIRP